MDEKFIRLLKWGGMATLLIYWGFTLWSIYSNPWFSFFHNALSDLGGGRANSPWIYNYGLIIASPFLFLFSVFLIYYAENKLRTVGGAFILISSIFLAFIGVFHSGTRPHGFVSSYFFIQFFFGMLLWGIGVKGLERILCTSLFIAALLGAFLPWPSTALIEVYEIFIIAIFAVWIPLHKY